MFKPKSYSLFSALLFIYGAVGNNKDQNTQIIEFTSINNLV
ncbi:hypothetical protein THALO_80003 [Tenacibaculum halocynthiae]